MFRTPVGFHDAYVAAPSRKAALAAWGSGTDLFTQGAAELVTDPELTKEPLARPGEVVRRLRGTADEQIAALGARKKKEAGPRIKGPHQSSTLMGTRSGVTKKGSGRGGRKRGRRPSAAAVERAGQAIARAEERHRSALHKLRAEAAAIDERRRALEAKRRAERDRLEAALDEARERYRSAMEEWAQ